MPVGPFTGFINGVDPSGPVTLDAGNLRKFFYLQVWESTVDPAPSLDIGDVVATEPFRILEGNIGIELWVWNEAAIALWADLIIDYLDIASLGDQSHGWFTVTDIDQANFGALQQEDSGAAITTVTLATPSSAADDILSISIDRSRNRAQHIHGDEAGQLTQRMEFSVTAYSARVSYGAGGGTRAVDIVLSNDLFSTSAFAGMSAVIAPSTAAVPIITEVTGDVPAEGAQIAITGTVFEAAQGGGSVRISPTDNVADAGAVVQTIDSWADDSIDITIVRGTLNLDDGLYLFVTNDSGGSNADGFAIALAPNVTLAFVDSLTLTVDIAFSLDPLTPGPGRGTTSYFHSMNSWFVSGG